MRPGSMLAPGTYEVAIELDARGVPTLVQLTDGPHPDADAIEEALGTWRARPFLVGGEAVAVRAYLRIEVFSPQPFPSDPDPNSPVAARRSRIPQLRRFVGHVRLHAPSFLLAGKRAITAPLGPI